MKCRPRLCASAASVRMTPCFVLSNEACADSIDSGGSNHNSTSPRPARAARCQYPRFVRTAITTRLLANIMIFPVPRNDTRNGEVVQEPATVKASPISQAKKMLHRDATEQFRLRGRIERAFDAHRKR